MASMPLISSVSKKLNFYLETKRLEDKFDLSINGDRLQCHMTSALTTYPFMYDRSLKHYFKLPKVKAQLTQMKLTNENEEDVDIKRFVRKNLQEHLVPIYSSRQKSSGTQKDCVSNSASITEENTQKQTGTMRKIRNLEELPNINKKPYNISQKEVQRLVSVVTRLMSSFENIQPEGELLCHKTPHDKRKRRRRLSLITSNDNIATDNADEVLHKENENRPGSHKTFRPLQSKEPAQPGVENLRKKCLAVHYTVELQASYIGPEHVSRAYNPGSDIYIKLFGDKTNSKFALLERSMQSSDDQIANFTFCDRDVGNVRRVELGQILPDADWTIDAITIANSSDPDTIYTFTYGQKTLRSLSPNEQDIAQLSRSSTNIGRHSSTQMIRPLSAANTRSALHSVTSRHSHKKQSLIRSFSSSPLQSGRISSATIDEKPIVSKLSHDNSKSDSEPETLLHVTHGSLPVDDNAIQYSGNTFVVVSSDSKDNKKGLWQAAMDITSDDSSESDFSDDGKSEENLEVVHSHIKLQDKELGEKMSKSAKDNAHAESNDENNSDEEIVALDSHGHPLDNVHTAAARQFLRQPDHKNDDDRKVSDDAEMFVVSVSKQDRDSDNSIKSQITEHLGDLEEDNFKRKLNLVSEDDNEESESYTLGNDEISENETNNQTVAEDKSEIENVSTKESDENVKLVKGTLDTDDEHTEIDKKAAENDKENIKNDRENGIENNLKYEDNFKKNDVENEVENALDDSIRNDMAGDFDAKIDTRRESSGSALRNLFGSPMIMELHTPDDEQVMKYEPFEPPTIHDMIRSNDITAVSELLLSSSKSHISDDDGEGNLPLHTAVKHGMVAMVRQLCRYGADLTSYTVTGYLPVHLAVLHNQLPCLQVLKELDADLNALTIDGSTCLHLAVYDNNLKLVEWLLENGANAQLKNKDHFSASKLADNYGYDEIMEFIKKKSALSVEFADNNQIINDDRSMTTPTSDEDESEETDSVKSLPKQQSILPDQKINTLTRRDSQQMLMEERRKSFERQQALMSETGKTFLDVVQNDVDN